MWKALIRLFFRPHPSTPAPRQSETRAEPESADKLQDTTVGLDINQAFISLVLGNIVFLDIEIDLVEKSTLKYLDRLLSAEVFDEKMIPRLPAVVPQLLSSLRNEETSGKNLADQIGHDPILVGEVIRIANSAFYNRSAKINNLERAVVILGRTGLQRLIANMLMKPIFNIQQGHFGQQGGHHLWLQSERCAFACAYLAKGRFDLFDAYLVGMVAKIGLIVTLRILDRFYKNRALPKSAHFYQELLLGSKRLSCYIAENWQFPSPVLDALREQIAMKSPPRQPSLGEVLYRANRISELHILVEEKHLENDISYLNQQLNNKLSAMDMRCYAELMRTFKPGKI